MEPDMTDVIVSATSKATYDAIAQECGFYQPEGAGPRGTTIPGHIITQGQLSGGGSYYFNYVGVYSIPTGNTIQGIRGSLVAEYAPVTDTNGNLLYWARLTINGGITQTFQTLVASAKAHGCDVYLKYPIGPLDGRGNPSLVWSLDGLTVAPSYIGNIGLIL